MDQQIVSQATGDASVCAQVQVIVHNGREEHYCARPDCNHWLCDQAVREGQGTLRMGCKYCNPSVWSNR